MGRSLQTVENARRQLNTRRTCDPSWILVKRDATMQLVSPPLPPRQGHQALTSSSRRMVPPSGWSPTNALRTLMMLCGAPPAAPLRLARLRPPAAACGPWWRWAPACCCSGPIRDTQSLAPPSCKNLRRAQDQGREWDHTTSEKATARECIHHHHDGGFVTCGIEGRSHLGSDNWSGRSPPGHPGGHDLGCRASASQI